MTNVNACALAAQSAATALAEHPEAETVEERLRVAMEATYRHWMATDDDDQLIGAVAAVLEVSEGEDRERLQEELDALTKVGAALAASAVGVPVDFGPALDGIDPDRLIGIRRIWNEAKEASTKP